MYENAAIGANAVGRKELAQQFLSRPDTQKKLKFVGVSAIGISISMSTLAITYYLLGWDRSLSMYGQFTAFITSTIASFTLNRRWVFGKKGRANLRTEVFPFWGIGLLQLAISFYFVNWGRKEIELNYTDKLTRTIGFLLVNLFVYAVMWIAKFIFFDKILFANKSETPSQ